MALDEVIKRDKATRKHSSQDRDQPKAPTQTRKRGGRGRKGKFRNEKQIEIQDGGLKRMLTMIIQGLVMLMSDTRRLKAATWDTFIILRTSTVYKNLEAEYKRYIEMCRQNPKNASNGTPAQW